MNSQSLILLGSGLFVAIIVATLAYDEFQQREHRPTEPAGLIWQVTTAFDRVRDLEMLLEVDASSSGIQRRADMAPQLTATEEMVTVRPDALATPVQILMRYLNDGQPALSLRYPVGDQDLTNDELLVVDGGRLSHFLPDQNTTITRFGLSRLGLAQIALAGFRLDTVGGTALDAPSRALSVEQDVSGLPPDLFAPAPPVPTTIAGEPTGRGGLCLDGSRCANASGWSFVTVSDPMSQGPIQGGYVLKVTDAQDGSLQAMIWVDRDDFTVRKTVLFVDGRRAYSMRVLRLELNPGLTRDDVIALPRGAMEIEG
jgi:hypothetical protein